MLAYFESLLSVSGDERGMLEDMVHAVQSLRTVRITFACHENVVGDPVRISYDKGILLVLALPEIIF